MYWDRPFNTWLGCRPISPACDNCYARCATVDRFGQSFEPHRTKKFNPPSKGIVFCGNMTDLFGDWIDLEEIKGIVATTMKKNDDAKFIWLTKRVDRMKRVLEYWATLQKPEYWLRNSVFGFTAENQEWFDRRAPIAAAFPDCARVWLSAEPLLGRIRMFHPIIHRLSWVVVGCESGPNRRPCKLEWIESIVDQCSAANVPVFVKQLDINNKCERDITKFPAHLQIRQVPWVKKGGA